jgi:hypothetical protein
MIYPHIEAKGDPFEIGHALGRRGGAAFRGIVQNLERYRALSPFLGGERMAAIEACSRRAYPALMREMDGMAEGAEVGFDELFLWNCRGDLPGASAIAGSQGCTDIIVPGDPESGLPAVIAHNEDDAPDLADDCFLATVETPGEPGFTSFCSPGLLPGHTFAVNASGLVQTINHIRPRDQKVGIARHIIARAVLGCPTLAAARRILERTDRASGFHHNLGEMGSMTALSVEAPASGCAVRTVREPRAHANHLVFEAFAGIDQEIARSSRERQDRAEALIGSGAAGRDPLAVLSDTQDPDWPICRKRQDGPDTGYTLATAVFEIGLGGVQWRLHRDPREAPAATGAVGVEMKNDGNATAIAG